MKWAKQKGFTIVELLIVIVVIGILATITIVAYNGIQNKTKTSVVQNNISQAIRKLETMKVSDASEQYPATQALAALQASGGVTLGYYYDAAANRYCIEAISGTIAYSQLGNTESVKAGRCFENGLIGWWTMNNTPNDQSGNASNGIATDVVGMVGQNGTANSAYNFNGTTSNVTVPTSAAMHPQSMTIGMWVRPTAWNSATATAFMTKRGGNNGYFLFYLNGTSSVNFDVAGAGARWNTQFTPPLNQWTHIVITAGPNGRTFYVNGTLFSSNAAIASDVIANSSDLVIGRESTNGYPYNGSIDDVRLYSRVLSASEAQALYTQGAQ